MPERADRITSRRKTPTRQTANNIKGLAVNITLETCIWSVTGPNFIRHSKYRGADKSLVRPGRKQTNVSVRMA